MRREAALVGSGTPYISCLRCSWRTGDCAVECRGPRRSRVSRSPHTGPDALPCARVTDHGAASKLLEDDHAEVALKPAFRTAAALAGRADAAKVAAHTHASTEVGQPRSLILRSPRHRARYVAWCTCDEPRRAARECGSRLGRSRDAAGVRFRCRPGWPSVCVRT